jgi:microcystin-dependent protein
MPSDTNSALLGLLMQATGNNNNTWGDNLNEFVFTYLEQAVAGYVTKSVTGGAATLTAAQQRAGMIEFTGTLTSNSTVTVDNISKRWRIFNNTDGAFVLLMKTASGTAIEIPQGTHKNVICDGADNLYRDDEDEVGNFVLHGGTTAPAGTLACSGGTFVRADHPNLFDKIGTTWGAGNGVTTAGLPDFVTNNRFMRAAGGSLSVGTYQSSQNKAHTHTASASTSVTGSTSSNGDHYHSAGIYDPSHQHSMYNSGVAQAGPDNGGVVGNDGGSNGWGGVRSSYPTQGAYTGVRVNSTNGLDTTYTSGAHTHTISASATTTVTVNSDGGTEARPENGAVLVCIKI